MPKIQDTKMPTNLADLSAEAFHQVYTTNIKILNASLQGSNGLTIDSLIEGAKFFKTCGGGAIIFSGLEWLFLAKPYLQKQGHKKGIKNFQLKKLYDELKLKYLSLFSQLDYYSAFVNHYHEIVPFDRIVFMIDEIGIPLSDRKTFEQTLLHLFACNGDVSIIRKLKAHYKDKFNINCLDHEMYIPLFNICKSIEKNRYPLFKAFIEEFKPDLSYRSHDGSVLLPAMIFLQKDIINYLVDEQKFDINEVNRNGMTLYDIAVYLSEKNPQLKEMIVFLQKKGALSVSALSEDKQLPKDFSKDFAKGSPEYKFAYASMIGRREYQKSVLKKTNLQKTVYNQEEIDSDKVIPSNTNNDTQKQNDKIEVKFSVEVDVSGNSKEHETVVYNVVSSPSDIKKIVDEFSGKPSKSKLKRDKQKKALKNKGNTAATATDTATEEKMPAVSKAQQKKDVVKAKKRAKKDKKKAKAGNKPSNDVVTNSETLLTQLKKLLKEKSDQNALDALLPELTIVLDLTGLQLFFYQRIEAITEFSEFQNLVLSIYAYSYCPHSALYIHQLDEIINHSVKVALLHPVAQALKPDAEKVTQEVILELNKLLKQFPITREQMQTFHEILKQEPSKQDSNVSTQYAYSASRAFFGEPSKEASRQENMPSGLVNTP